MDEPLLTKDYQAAALATKYAALDQDELDLSFHGGLAPHYELQKEEARHRLMLYLVGQGLTNTEVAEKIGCSAATVSNTKRQQWFQNKLGEILGHSGQSVIDVLLKGEALESLQTLVELRDDKSQKGSVRASCAFGLLEHTIGKAVQRTETDVKVKHTYETIHQVDAELAKLEEEERQLKVVKIQQNVA